MYCEKCGHELKEEAKFCPKCGMRQNVVSANKKGISKSILIIGMICAAAIGITVYAINSMNNKYSYELVNEATESPSEKQPVSEIVSETEAEGIELEAVVDSPDMPQNQYSRETLVEGIPLDYWDQFVPEIEKIYSATDAFDGAHVYDIPPDAFIQNLEQYKATFYQELFESVLPVDSPPGYYLLGLEHENIFIQLYSVCSLSKYVFTEYEDACLNSLSDLLDRINNSIDLENEGTRVLKDQTQKFINFLEHDFNYHSEIFEDSYIWASPDKKKVVWSRGMVPNTWVIDTVGEAWIYDGERVWSVDMATTFDGVFSDDGSAFSFTKMLAISYNANFTIPVGNNWEEKIASNDTISGVTPNGDLEEISYDEIIREQIYPANDKSDKEMPSSLRIDDVKEIYLLGGGHYPFTDYYITYINNAGEEVTQRLAYGTWEMENGYENGTVARESDGIFFEKISFPMESLDYDKDGIVEFIVGNEVSRYNIESLEGWEPSLYWVSVCEIDKNTGLLINKSQEHIDYYKNNVIPNFENEKSNWATGYEGIVEIYYTALREATQQFINGAFEVKMKPETQSVDDIYWVDTTIVGDVMQNYWD